MIIGVGGVGVLMALCGRAVHAPRGLGAVIVSLLFATAPKMAIPLRRAAGLRQRAAAGGPPVGDVGWAVYFVNERSLRQSIMPDRLLGRMNASVDVVVVLAWSG